MISANRFSVAVLLLLGFLIPVPSTAASEVLVDSTSRLSAAIENASDGDIIALAGDILLEGYLPSITVDITIEGGGHKINGLDRRSIFFIEENVTVHINDLRMTGGYADNCLNREYRRKRDVPDCPDPAKWKHGGAIYNDGGNLTISNSSFRDNSTEGYGGAIYSRKGRLYIANSRFIGNSSNGHGGALANALGDLTITSSQFWRNSSDEAGGAIMSSSSSSSSILASSFNHNWASWGGAIKIDGDTLTIANSSFTANVAEAGGGIFSTGVLHISDGRFDFNSAEWGGAIDTYFSKLTIHKSVFKTNTARYGGAIEDDASDLDITGSAFIDNSAEKRGGAINKHGGSLRVTYTDFIHNAAVDEGKALHIISALGRARVSVPDDATETGGSLYLHADFEDVSAVFRSSFVAGSPANCLDGRARPQGAGCDIGAYEYAG